MKAGAWIDSILASHSSKGRGSIAASLPTRSVETPVGLVRVYDSRTHKPTVVLVPDGPNVIEHYSRLVELLAPHLRVVCFDMPGFGHSLPSRSYEHSLDQGAGAVLGVLDALHIESTALAFSCANGFYALRAAQIAPERISCLVLSQTPSLGAMQQWVDRIIPKPLTIPGVGQVAAWLFRKKVAKSWYRTALPKTTLARPFQHIALQALADGACFCLAGVVQGLCRESEALSDVRAPVTVVWGTMDRSHKLTDPHSLCNSTPHAEVVRFEDCGHFPDVEQPERYAALLLERVLQTSGSNPYGAGAELGLPSLFPQASP
ncbi:alpha/beta fold hydrolase [Pseudoduganella armeniaca]|uniref:Alpha/beta hydrolase n=1 Tax=Pseudoduganella armeniaca TaxID=2072590 RepID=A0A2R4C9X7_9BURK|nr:alpha/beta hydrolase [Pseudoduganella armeniaca]AVR96426.1 alpha/beta hydrolase [Pseudoduganella armeniaca]